ncbi:MAG: hypothetical protein AAB932_06630 [Patescibacteria group bacterium]
MNQQTDVTTHPYPPAGTASAFKRAKEAVQNLLALRGSLSLAERETLTLLFDADAMETIRKSVAEADAGFYEPFEQAVANE